MAAGIFILVLLAIGAVIGIGVVVSAGRDDRLTAARQSNKELTAEVKSGRLRERAATKALRSIANGAGNPALEAQIALDEIDNLETKELT